MIYEWTITTSTSYSSSSKLKTPLKLEFGIIQELLINFPPGPAGLHFLQISHGLSQAFPKTKGFFHGDRVLLEFRNVGYPLLAEPYELTAYTWNDSTLYSHNLSIYINLIRLARFP